MRKMLILLAAGLALSAAATAAPRAVTCESGTVFAGGYVLGDAEIEARDAAMLRFLGLRVYSAALYLDPDTPSRRVLDDVPKALEIRYHRSISASQLVKAAENVVEDMPRAEVESVRAGLETMYAAFVDVDEGDRYRLVYEPGVGSTLELNGEPQVVVPGVDFQRVFFGIWLSEHALSPKLRDRLLGYRD